MKARKGRAREAALPVSKAEVPIAIPWYLRRQFPLACLALIALSLVAYANSFSAGFALDSGPLLQDPRIHELSARHLSQIVWHSYWWPTGEAGLYRPLTTFSWLFNYAILGNGMNPAGYHWINWLLHSGNVFLVFALALRLRMRFRLSFCLAALWAVHPILTESVTNVAGRSDLMGAMAVLGGLLLYLRSADAVDWSRARWLAGLAVVSAAGACSKESAVVLPGLIVLCELVWWKRARVRSLLLGCLATLLPIGLVLWQRWAVLSAALPAEFPFVDNPIVTAGFWRGRLTALAVLGRYVWLTLWPARLSSDYSFAQIPLATGSASDWLACAMVAALIAAVLAFRRNRLAFFFAGFAFLNLLPASNLLFPSGTIMAERLLYLPSVGLLAILVIIVDSASSRLPRPSVVAAVIFVAIGAGYTVRTLMRNPDWRDDLTMATVNVETSPDSFKTHRALAADLMQSDPSHSNIDRVIAEAERSIAILAPVPDENNTVSAWNIAANAHIAKGMAQPSEAHREYERAALVALRATEIEAVGRAAFNRRHGTHVQPVASAAESFRILAYSYLRLDQPERALKAATQARTIDPSIPEAYAEMAEAEFAEKRGEDAAIALEEGMFVTSDPILRDNLLTVYRSGIDTEGCALVAGPNGLALNPSCAVVRRDFCAAAAHVRRHDVLDQLACGKEPKPGS